ncbi:hypothetical protein DFQ28_010417 [Apophysomyces sp. BC1034]|nr:hypothetical protein DFQ28_010417 [Apophysomyces sp. BC1034]
MLTVVLGGFGFSTAWLIVLAWRLARALWPGGTGLRGPGTIRLWLGAAIVLVSSSALEARLTTPTPHDAIGRASAADLSTLVGAPGSIAIFTLLFVAALPWLFGARWPQCIAYLHRTFGVCIGSGARNLLRDERRVMDSDVPPGQREALSRVFGNGGFGPNDTRGKRPSASRWPDARQAPRHIGVTRGFTGPSPEAQRRMAPRTPPRPYRPSDNYLGRSAAPHNGAMDGEAPIDSVLAPAPAAQSIAAMLRAIEQQAAQWTALADANLARQDDGRIGNASVPASASGGDASPPASAPAATLTASSNTGVSMLRSTAATQARHATQPDSSPPGLSPVPPAAITQNSEPAPRQASTTAPAASADEAGSIPSTPGVASHLAAAPDGSATPLPTQHNHSAGTFTAPPPARTATDDMALAASRALSSDAFSLQAPEASYIELPALDLLASGSDVIEPVSDGVLAATGQLIEQRLKEFKVPVSVIGASAGPVITRFEVEPALGVRGSQIVGLMKDLSRGLGLTSIRVVETIPGKTCMGLELPNAQRQVIRLAEILASREYCDSASQLTLALGKDITGEPVVTDLARAPHMLVAGTTGSGKSVAINAMILSLLYKATPQNVRLIMIDPKMLELSVYEGIPHLLAPVVTDMKLAANALTWCVAEMEKRYRLMSALGVRNLAGFNQKIHDAQQLGRKVDNPFSLTPDAPEPLSPLPMIVVVIDELADLMMVSGKKLEELIARLIKANIPTRVAFQVSSKIDSRTILDQMGAESLLGQGDMLFLPPGTGYPQRVHGAFVADDEVHRVVEYLKQFGEPEYEDGILAGVPGDHPATDLLGDAPDAQADPLYDEAVAFVVRSRRASISSVQRQLRIGYNRAARLVEQMEAAGLVSSMGVNGSREVLAPAPAD